MGMYPVFYMNIIHVYNYVDTICLYSVITLLCSKPQARPPREKIKELNENRVVVVVVVVVVGRSLTPRRVVVRRSSFPPSSVAPTIDDRLSLDPVEPTQTRIQSRRNRTAQPSLPLID
jgi:hypothetical protein